MTIKVTKEDIRKGKRGNCYKCPTARALKRAGLIEPSVWHDIILVKCGTDLLRFRTPRSVERFINRFDEGKTVEPFNFILRMQDGDQKAKTVR